MIGRRALLLSGGALTLGLTGAVSASLWACASRADGIASLPYERLNVVFADILGVNSVGRAIRERVTFEEVEASFFSQPLLVSAMLVQCDESRRKAFRGAFREGFRSGDVLTVDRWVLSRAECTIAALSVA